MSQQQPVMFPVPEYSLSELVDAEFQIHSGNPTSCYSCRPGWWEVEGKELGKAGPQQPAVHWGSELLLHGHGMRGTLL